MHPLPGKPRHIRAPVDMVGKQFGWLTAISREGSTMRLGTKKNATWRCVCTCGQQVIVPGNRLRHGKRKACGVNGHVWARQSRGGLLPLHPNEYRTFKHMHARCRNKKSHNYNRYGGRGIKVCKHWRHFKEFFVDMGVKPTSEHTIERIDVNGNYEPANCRWATKEEQRRNQQRSVYVEYEGERMLLIDLCAKLGINRGIMYGRLRNGWSLGDALLIPVNHHKKKSNL